MATKSDVIATAGPWEVRPDTDPVDHDEMALYHYDNFTCYMPKNPAKYGTYLRRLLADLAKLVEVVEHRPPGRK